MLGWGFGFEGGVERSMTHCGGGGMEASIAREDEEGVGRGGRREWSWTELGGRLVDGQPCRANWSRVLASYKDDGIHSRLWLWGSYIQGQQVRFCFSFFRYVSVDTLLLHGLLQFVEMYLSQHEGCGRPVSSCLERSILAVSTI